ncbi:MAG: hypothetical protein IIA67_14140 [Planctomycetes bacterium]|nr:hypothetical protein [Planctomycetota bacterium]
MISGPQIVRTLADLGATHVVWVPDSTTGQWEDSLETAEGVELLRVCREGEAWPLAAGLTLGGKTPLVMMQITGFFESGDAMRNVLFDLKLPIFSLIGYRGYLVEGSTDTARTLTEPLLDAWGLSHVLIRDAGDLPKLIRHWENCRAQNTPGVALLAEKGI